MALPTDTPSPSMPDPAAPPPPGNPSPAVSKLAAKVAHELNNPLDAVLRFVSLAQRKARSGDYAGIDRYLADAQFGLQRMAEILRELMDIGRETNDILAARAEQISLPELIAHALRTVAGLAEQRHVALLIENSLPPNTPAHYDLRLSQILANLLKNAIEASPEASGATVTLTATLAPQNSALVITILDQGPGIPDALQRDLFTPFVTTKPRGKGHGLGLAISRELALSLGATLTLHTHPTPPGSLATITLPLP
ncbi:MAG TPA: HAMP domain-containing sensor histidine kinase [Phycisphaerae bacterium]|nr:HAMP domain-containing sensor histidine kinase [Phycisphaerae bacterium]